MKDSTELSADQRIKNKIRMDEVHREKGKWYVNAGTPIENAINKPDRIKEFLDVVERLCEYYNISPSELISSLESKIKNP